MSSDLSDRLRDALRALGPGRPEAIEALRPLYDEAVEFRDPIQTLRGLDAFLAMNRRLMGRVRALSFEVTSARGDADEVFLAWTMRATARIGPTIVVDGVTHARARAGKVVHHRDYWDLGQMLASIIPGGERVLRGILRPLA